MSATFKAADVRAKYPRPHVPGGTAAAPWPGQPPEDYCVGGALCLFVDGRCDGTPGQLFPSQKRLADMLRGANPVLSVVTSDVLAGIISDHNDAGQFDEAWATLDRALQA